MLDEANILLNGNSSLNTRTIPNASAIGVHYNHHLKQVFMSDSPIANCPRGGWTISLEALNLPTPKQLKAEVNTVITGAFYPSLRWGIRIPTTLK